MNTKTFSRGKIKILKSGGKQEKKGGVESGVESRRGLMRLKGIETAASPPPCPGSDDEISCFPHQVTINLYLMGAMVLI